MKKSKVFCDNAQRETLEKKIKLFLNKQRGFLSARASDSLRAVGDAVESIIAENLETILGDVVGEYSASFARRAMADVAFIDRDGFYYVVDVKTHRLDTRFNMPNLTSVERLSRFYEEDVNYFSILKVDYEIDHVQAKIEKVTFAPIEFFDWSCLTIGALGWGQVQIANANVVTVVPDNSRKKWMLELCEAVLAFYPKEIGKINQRIAHFEKIRKIWQRK